MPPQLVPDILHESPSERYEARMDDILNYIEQWFGAVDIKAVRILLAAVFHNCWTDEPPIWIWATCPPRKLDQAIGHALGRLLLCPKPDVIAKELRTQTTAAKSLWCLTGMEGIFHRAPAEVEAGLRQFAEMSTGMYDWDGKEPFGWEGRITVLATTWRPLDRLQIARCHPVWPLVQNVFTAVRFADMGVARLEKLERARAAQDSGPIIVKTLRQMVINLMDEDNRDPLWKVKVPRGYFDDLIYLCELVSCLRGPGYSVELLLQRAQLLAVSHGRMMGKESVDAEDHSIVRKILLDSIPPAVVEFLKALPLDGYWTLPQAYGFARQTPSTIRRVVELLCSVRAVLVGEGPPQGKRKGVVHYAVSPELQRVLMGGL